MQRVITVVDNGFGSEFVVIVTKAKSPAPKNFCLIFQWILVKLCVRK